MTDQAENPEDHFSLVGARLEQRMMAHSRSTVIRHIAVSNNITGIRATNTMQYWITEQTVTGRCLKKICYIVF